MYYIFYFLDTDGRQKDFIPSPTLDLAKKIISGLMKRGFYAWIKEGKT